MAADRKTCLLLLASLALSACAASPRMDLREPGVRSEKEIIRALTKVEATDAQRSAVLAAFDAALPRLKGLQAERAALQEQLRSLSPKQPGYLDRSQALARQWGELHAREVEAFASFEYAVASSLSDTQWRQWRDYSADAAFAAAGPSGGPGRRQPE